MSKNQQAVRRYRVILKKLSRPGRHSSRDIYQTCLNSGIEVGYRTIQKDLEDLRDDYSIFGMDLGVKEDKKQKKWYCETLPSEIFKYIELDEDEIDALLFYAKTINQYREYPFFNKISEAISKVIDGTNISKQEKELFNSEELLQTERHPRVKGTEYIPQILNSIYKKRILEIEYEKFDATKAKRYRIKPFQVKEDKHLWYLVGENTSINEIRIFALDRIKSILETDTKFEPTSFDHNEYFKHSFGITVHSQKPIEVLVEFNHSETNYIRTLPIHPSQKIVEETKNGLLVKFVLSPSYEFYSKILSYGEGANVISPASVRNEVLSRINGVLTKYAEK